MPPSTHERLARSKKVAAIVDTLWLHLTDAERRNPDLPDHVRKMGNAWRDAVAHKAGQRTPSPTTWAAVSDRIAELVAQERARAHRRTA